MRSIASRKHLPYRCLFESEQQARCSQVPHGLTKSIAFSTVERVGVHADEPTVLLLECVTRQYFFRFPSVVLCEAWAGLITVAASAAR